MRTKLREASARLARHGPNEIEHEKAWPWWWQLWHCYKNPFNLLLTVLAGLSYLSHDAKATVVTGWMVADRESAELAKYLLDETIHKHNILPGQLTIHADRGRVMLAKPVAMLYADLGITKSHSRPYVSDDNPFSESQFRTLKYRPNFPARFGCLLDSRAHCQVFFPGYNEEHRHSSLGMLTPAMVHFDQTATILAQRQTVLDADRSARH